MNRKKETKFQRWKNGNGDPLKNRTLKRKKIGKWRWKSRSYSREIKMSSLQNNVKRSLSTLLKGGIPVLRYRWEIEKRPKNIGSMDPTRTRTWDPLVTGNITHPYSKHVNSEMEGILSTFYFVCTERRTGHKSFESIAPSTRWCTWCKSKHCGKAMFKFQLISIDCRSQFSWKMPRCFKIKGNKRDQLFVFITDTQKWNYKLSTTTTTKVKSDNCTNNTTFNTPLVTALFLSMIRAGSNRLEIF